MSLFWRDATDHGSFGRGAAGSLLLQAECLCFGLWCDGHQVSWLLSDGGFQLWKECSGDCVKSLGISVSHFKHRAQRHHLGACSVCAPPAFSPNTPQIAPVPGGLHPLPSVLPSVLRD